MEQTTLVSQPLLCSVFMVEIFRLKNGPDYLALSTNLPDPMSSRGRGQVFYIWCPRGTGETWAKTTFPRVERHLYDYENGHIVANAANPERGSSLLDDLYNFASVGG